MLKSYWKTIAGNMRRIEKLWAARGCQDATAEPEWPEYEGYLYEQAALVIKYSTWRNRGADPMTGEIYA